MSSAEPLEEEPVEEPNDPRDFSNLKQITTTTDRVILYNTTDARERLSSELVIPVEP